MNTPLKRIFAGSGLLAGLAFLAQPMTASEFQSEPDGLRVRTPQPVPASSDPGAPPGQTGGTVTRDDWPQWRGPDRSNTSRSTGLLSSWPTNGPPLLWTLTGLGEGITAMAVADGRAYTLGYREDAEYLFCLDAVTGESRWASPVGAGADPKSVFTYSLMRWLSPRVPTVDADRIYTVSADGLLTCLRTADGAELWRRHYANDLLSHPRHWGFCDYPLVDGERLICVPGGPEATVAALNKHTGALLWKTLLPGEEVNHYAAPILSTAGGIRHYVVFLRNGLTGFAAEDGRILWRYGKTTAHLANSFTPIVRNDLLFSANGYGGGMALLRIVPEEDGLAVVEQYHRRFQFSPFQDNTVWVGDHVYAVRGAGELVCFDLATGALVWEERDDNPKRRAALTYAEGHLYVRRSDGSVTLVEATPRGYVVGSSFRIANPEEVSGVTFPVIAGGRLYLRDNDRLLCYDVRADALAQPQSEPKTLSVLLNRGSGPARANPPAVSRTGVDRPPDAIFVPTPGDVVERMIELAALDTNSVLYDLGSGDGRIVIAAARKHGCRAVGYEIDPRLVEQSREAVRAQGLEHLVRIEHADFFTVDLSGADAVAVYLPSNLLGRLRPQFDKLKPGARIVSHQFRLPGTRYEPPVDLISKEDGDRHLVFHYTMPIPAPGP